MVARYHHLWTNPDCKTPRQCAACRGEARSHGFEATRSYDNWFRMHDRVKSVWWQLSDWSCHAIRLVKSSHQNLARCSKLFHQVAQLRIDSATILVKSPMILIVYRSANVTDLFPPFPVEAVDQWPKKKHTCPCHKYFEQSLWSA